MTHKVLSVNISESFIKLVEAGYSGKSVTVYRTMIVPTPAEACEDGYLRRIDDIARSIKIAMANGGFKAKKIMFSIYSSRIATRDIYIPEVKEKNILEIINTNAGEYFPVNIEDYLISYTIKDIVVIDNVRKLKLTAYAVPEIMALGYYDLASVLDMDVVSIDYAGNSSNQLVEKCIQDGTILVVHMEREYTIVTIYKDKEVKIQRMIPYGMELVTGAIMSSRGISDITKILDVIHNEKIIHETFDGDEITESLRYFISNVYRVVDYYNSKFEEHPVEKIYITGEATDLKGIDGLCKNEFKLNVEILGLNGFVEDKNPNITHNSIDKYVLNIGTLIKPCGFVTKSAQYAKKKKSNSRYVRLLFGATIIAAGVLVFVPLPDYLNARKRVSDVKKGIEDLQPIQGDVDKYFAYKDAYTDIENFDKLTNNNNSKLNEFIKELEKNSPSDISVSTMSINNGAVSIYGSASAKESVAKYAIELKNISYISEVKIYSMSETENDDGVVTVSFSISFQINNYTEETEE